MLTLGRVINALVEHSGHVPYRYIILGVDETDNALLKSLDTAKTDIYNDFFVILVTTGTVS